MEIHLEDKKLRRALQDDVSCKRLYGDGMAQKIRLRLSVLYAADSLEDFWPPKSGPERCHELIGNREGIFSIDLKQPYRLLFKVHEEQASSDRSKEQQRWKSIKSISIVAIEDTHGQ